MWLVYKAAAVLRTQQQWSARATKPNHESTTSVQREYTYLESWCSEQKEFSMEICG